MKTPARSILLCWSVGILMASASGSFAETKLEWKFQKGQELRYVMEQTSDMQMTRGPANITMTQTTIIDIVMRIKNVADDGSADIGQKITRSRMIMEGGPLGTIKLDSDDDTVPENPIAQQMAGIINSMVGPEFKVEMNKYGKAIKTEIPEEIKQALSSAGQLGGSGFYSEESFKKMLQSSPAVPSHAVTVGQTWTSEDKVEMGFMGMARSTTTSTYRGLAEEGKGRLHKIELKVATRIDKGDGEKGKPVPLKLLKMKNEESSGHLLFDNQVGRVEKYVLRQSFTMEAEIGGQKIEQEIKSRMIMKLVPAKKPAG